MSDRTAGFPFINIWLHPADAFSTQQLQDNQIDDITDLQNKWRVVLEGKNLSDERELVNTFNVSNVITGGYNRERTWASPPACA